MGDIQTRPFSKNYSGLVNQSVIALGITVLCITSQEYMKRKRRGKTITEGLGSRESWEFGYLYQGRSWARKPSPPSPGGWPLSWVKQIVNYPEEKMLELRGLDATLYIRFLRGCFWFTLLHTLTTFPVLFPIHVEFSEATVSSKSMTRASISSLVNTRRGLSLLWIHICLLFWVTLTWVATLLWICNGAFKMRAATIEAADRRRNEDRTKEDHPHPHPQYRFTETLAVDRNHPNTGLRLRTVMVFNIPPALRNERDLKEYFEYYMSRKIEKPSMGITASTQPGFFNKSFAFLFNRAKRIPNRLPPIPLLPHSEEKPESVGDRANGKSANVNDIPVIERVVIVRKMSELASLLERREEVLHLLETAHIKLAQKVLAAVRTEMDKRALSGKNKIVENEKKSAMAEDLEQGPETNDVISEEAQMDRLIEALAPYVEEFGLRDSGPSRSSLYSFSRLRRQGSESSDIDQVTQEYTSQLFSEPIAQDKTVWDALFSLPRNSLDPYQPLVNLSHLFRGKTVPSIDYYTAKLNLLSSLITENRSKAPSDYDPVSTAFVTFVDPADARRACKYLAVHPNNPLACLVTMAPMYQEIDWMRLMKSSFNVEFVKDWVINLGVWAFTLFWLFPVSLFVGLVSIQNISLFWPSLKRYLDRHQWEEEVIQSFVPTILVALLALLIPLILLLIAKKADNITTLSSLHDRIMTRYYKFLIVNVLVFFCVGTAALQSVLQSLKSPTQVNVLQIVADSFPSAGPFYVGWLIFTAAMHSGFELALFGLPLLMYPDTRRQMTPRKRAVGIRPRTFNFYYWLPNHLLVLHILLVFSVLNPFVLPFGALYYFVQSGVVKNQLIHVYAKHYETNGQVILIRLVRYSLDGLILAQTVFLAYMVVLKRSANVGLAAFLIAFTATIKLLLTRMCRAQFEHDDVAEAEAVCDTRGSDLRQDRTEANLTDADIAPSKAASTPAANGKARGSSILTWKLPGWVNFTVISFNGRPRAPRRRPPNPFRPRSQSFSRLKSGSYNQERDGRLFAVTPSSPQREPPWGGASSLKLAAHVGPAGPVIPHAPPPLWDDQTTADLPYDNPFYSRPIDDVLWLPRNPCGILDLDDTVDLKASLTVERMAGQLEYAWFNRPETEPPEEMHTGVSLPSPPSPVDGTENIVLPFAIAKRVQSKEGGIASVPNRRPPVYHRQISGVSRSTYSGLSIRRGSSLLDELPLPYRSVTNPTHNAARPRSASMLSSLRVPSHASHPSPTEEKPGLRPDLHAQAEFVAKNGSQSRIASAGPSREHNLPVHEAILHEVVAEERVALVDRIEGEQAEADKATTTKSWLISWMFRKTR